MEEKPRKTSRGRQKIEMAKIKNNMSLQVTFSKRYKNLYKKANELGVLTGAEVAIVGFSPKNKPFSFGCPNLSSVLNKYENLEPLSESSNPTKKDDDFGVKSSLQRMNEEIMSLEDKLKEARKHGQVMDARIKQREKQWWEAPVEDLTLEQLDQFKMMLLDLKKDVLKAKASAKRVFNDSNDYKPIMDIEVPQSSSIDEPDLHVVTSYLLDEAKFLDLCFGK